MYPWLARGRQPARWQQQPWHGASGSTGPPSLQGLESLQPVAGHLEAVFEGQDFEVRIDAAQTPGALGEVLAALRSIASGRIHCVLSSDGFRDRAERRQLAAVAEMGADRVDPDAQ